jgi:ribonuclease HI
MVRRRARGAAGRGGALRAWVDGAARGNPGPASYGVLLLGPGGERLAELLGTLGRATNNVAEYRALLAALDWAQRHGAASLEVRTDSLLLANQVNGVWKVRDPKLRALHLEARAGIARLGGFSIRHVPREENREADRLANRALDEERKAAARKGGGAPAPAPPADAPPGGKGGSPAEDRKGSVPRRGPTQRSLWGPE